MTDRKLELYTSGGVVIESHLGFVDDIIFFCRASTKSMQALKNVLDEFCEFFGLSINTENSYVVFSKRVHDKAELAGILSFQLKELPICYLETPQMGKLITNKDCDPLISDLNAILTRWSGNFFFYMGRVELVEWIFHDKFDYLMQSTIMPHNTLQSIHSIAYRFTKRSCVVLYSSMIKPQN